MIGYEMIRTPDKRPTNHMSDNMSDFLHTRNTSSHVNIYNTVNTVQNNFEGSTWFVQVVIWGQFLHLRQFLQVFNDTDRNTAPNLRDLRYLIVLRKAMGWSLVENTLARSWITLTKMHYES